MTTPRYTASVRAFCDGLVAAADTCGGALPWPPFMGREAVRAELARRGFKLTADGAIHDPRLRRFFAVPSR